MHKSRQTCIYLTRKCPYRCNYCNLCNSNLYKPEMNTEQWLEAMRILAGMGIEFNLFLGNETWLFGEDLLKIVECGRIPYGVYSSCNPNVFRKAYKRMFKAGLDNLSCGVDSYQSIWKCGQQDWERKSFYAVQAFTKTRKEFPDVDCHATMTIGAYNAQEVTQLAHFFHKRLDMFLALNYIHSNTDGNFDFFPPTDELRRQGFLLDTRYRFGIMEKVRGDLYQMLHLDKDHSIQNLEDFLDMPFKFGVTGVTNDCWHCGGNPYGGPTIDADGSLRLCGYRKGETVPEMTVFDLGNKRGVSEWERRVKADAAKCPGCLWGYARLHASLRKTPDIARRVFNNHLVITTGDERKRKINK